jgi:branched-chain amino acid transport system substrate-binding protein
MAAEKVFQDMKDRGFKKIALISGSGGFDKSGRAQSLKLAPDYGLEIVADESYGNKDTDMTAQLTKIRGSKAEAILNFGFGKAPAIVTKNIKQLGIKLPVYQSHGVASKKYIELSGDAANGVRLPAAAIVVANELADNDPQKKVTMEYKKQFEAKHGQVSSFGAHAYDALMIAVKALEQAKGADKKAVRDAIEKTKDYIGAGGIFNMSADDHMGLKENSFKLLEIKNGQWSIVAKKAAK